MVFYRKKHSSFYTFGVGNLVIVSGGVENVMFSVCEIASAVKACSTFMWETSD